MVSMKLCQRSFLGAVLMLSAGCSYEGDHVTAGPRRTAKEMVNEAPYIAAAKVVGFKDRMSGKRVELDGTPLERTIVQLAIRKSIRGSLSTTLEFDAHRAETIQPPRTQMSSPPIQATGIFFLTNESGRYRAFSDPYSSYIPLCSSQTFDQRIARLSTQEEVAALLLEPSQGASSDCASTLGDRVEIAKSLIGRQATVRLLNEILSSSSGDLWMAACLSLSRSFYGQDECLQKAQTVSTREQMPAVIARVESNRSRDVIFLRHSSEGLRFLSQYTDESNAVDINDLLTHLMAHRDSRIAKNAFDVFRRNLKNF